MFTRKPKEGQPVAFVAKHSRSIGIQLVKVVVLEKIKILDQDAFVFIERDEPFMGIDYYNVTHWHTGMRMAQHPEKEHAIKVAEINAKTKPQAIANGIELLRLAGIKYPVNE